MPVWDEVLLGMSIPSNVDFSLFPLLAYAPPKIFPVSLSNEDVIEVHTSYSLICQTEKLIAPFATDHS